MAAEPTPSQMVLQYAAAERAGVEALGPPPSTLTESYKNLSLSLPSLSSPYEARLKVIRPTSTAAPRPLIVLVHGGGFFVGSPEQMTRPGREFATAYNAVVVSAAYPLVPEGKRFPAAVQAVWATLVWLSRHAESEFGAKLEKGFVVGGHSAGGNIAAVMGGLSGFGDDSGVVDEIGRLSHPVTGVWLNCPMLLREESVPDEYKSVWTSMKENKDNPPVTAEALEAAHKGYQPEEKSRWWSPVNALPAVGSGGSANYPKCYITACGLDPLRDDAVVFEKMLAARGYQSKIIVFPDDSHACWSVMPFPTNSKNPTMKEGTMAGMKWLLQQ